jgi:hypothetical protein
MLKSAAIVLAAMAAVFGGQAVAHADVSVKASCLAPQIPHGTALPLKNGITVRDIPYLSATLNCGSVWLGHRYNGACWDPGQTLPDGTPEGNNRWLRIQGDQGRWGYVAIALLAGDKTAGFSQCTR